MYVHGDNIARKEKEFSADTKRAQYLEKIRRTYEKWKKDNLSLKGPYSESPDNEVDDIINKRVGLLNDYKDFIEAKTYAEAFDSRSNLQSSVLEEFCYYLFHDLIEGIAEKGLVGKASALKSISYRPTSYSEMVKKPCFTIEQKAHDFLIGVNVAAKFQCEGEPDIQEEILQIPAVAIECKTYLDKTMLEGSSTTASQLMEFNPNSMYIILAEWLKLTDNINLKKYKIDQIYILRKQKNTDRKDRLKTTYQKNPIYADVVKHLFLTVREHLTKDWSVEKSEGLNRGYLIE